MRYREEFLNNQVYFTCPPPTPPVGIGRGLFNYYVGTSSPHPCEESSVIFYMCPPPSGRDEACPYMSPHPCEESSVIFYMCPPLSGRDEPCPYTSSRPCEKSSVTFYRRPPLTGRDEPCPYMSPRPCEESSETFYRCPPLTGRGECTYGSLQSIDLLNYNRGDDVLTSDFLDSKNWCHSRENGNLEAILKVTCRDLCLRSSESVPFYTEKSSRYA
jgi:hypothetical protein